LTGGRSPALLLSLPDPTGWLPPLRDIDGTLANERTHPRYASPASCGTCDGHRRFRFWAWASEEYAQGRVVDASGVPAPMSLAWYRCDCRGQWLAHRCYAGSGVAMAYQRLSPLDLFTPLSRTVFRARCASLAEDLGTGTGLFLCGNYGTGKTAVAVLLAKAAIRSGVTVYCTTFNQLLAHYRLTWDDDPEMRQWWERRVRVPSLLVLDDVGRETKTSTRQTGRSVTNMARSLLDDVLRHRNGIGLPTYLTTNLSAEDFAFHYGGAVMSLVSGSATTISFDDDDSRQVAAWRLARERSLGLRRPVIL